MKDITIQDLFEVGTTFESTIGDGSKSERARIPKNYSRINLSEDLVNEITSIDFEVNFLVSGEIWCPDFQLNATVLKKFCDLNTNFNMSVITMSRGIKFLCPILNIDKENFKAPTIVVLDKKFNILGTFIERPRLVKIVPDYETIKMDYLKGKYLLDTTSEILDIVAKGY